MTAEEIWLSFNSIIISHFTIVVGICRKVSILDPITSIGVRANTHTVALDRAF